MKIAVLIPDRNDRPKLLSNCLRMIEAQTFQPKHIEIVNDKPESDAKDISWRYRIGYDRLRNKNFDVIALIENDDWYSPDYFQTIISKWLEAGQPNIFGTDYTIYYHLKLKAWFTMYHKTRSAAMNTLIKPDLSMNWCQDHDPYTDIYLWQTVSGVTFTPDKHISIGMKHGEGLCGGNNHKNKLDRYVNSDANSDFLRQNLDENSFKFYSEYYK